MGFFDLFKKKAKQEVIEVVNKVQEMPTEQLVDNAADTIKKVTPDSVDKVVDQAADKINDQFNQQPPASPQPPAAA